MNVCLFALGEVELDIDVLEAPHLAIVGHLLTKPKTKKVKQQTEQQRR